MKINQKLLKNLGSRYFRISFVKKDGTFREISAKVTNEQHTNDRYWLVYDNKDKTYKTIIKKNILLIKQGKQYWR